MNKKKVSFLLAVIIIFVIVAYYRGWFLFSNHNIELELVPYTREIKKIEELSKSDPQEAEKIFDTKILPNLSKKLQHKIDFIRNGRVGGANFYGKVIDQNNNPVVHAKIHYLMHGAYLAPGSGLGDVYTDNNGLFHLSGKASTIYLEDIIHPNIHYNPPATAENQANIENRLLSEGQNDPISFSALNKYTEKTPYVFKVWRTDIFENVKSGERFFDINSDGTIYTLDFNKETSNEIIKKGNGGGHLRVSCNRPQMKTSRDYKDWKIVITPVNGGIQTTKDSYMDVAPDAGYKKSFIIDMKKDSPNYKTELNNQRYYFFTNNGEVYGSLFIHFEPHASNSRKGKIVNKCYLDMAFKINLEGTRNLAERARAFR